MKIKLSKRGISTVVATALILLLTIAAVTVLARYLIPFVNNNLARSSECIPYSDYFKFLDSFTNESGSYNYNCFIQSGGYYLISSMVQVNQNSSADNLAGFKLVYYNDNSGVTSKNVNQSVPNSNLLENVRMLGFPSSTSPRLSVPSLGEVTTYVYNSTTQYSKVEIYPVLKSGRICDKTDTVNLELCGNGINIG